MTRPLRRSLALSLFVTLAACSNEVAIVSGSGSTGDASSSGSGAPVPHPVVIDLDGGGPKYLDSIVVLLNHEDGSLVSNWKGAELPVTVDALDGDFVSYVHWEQLTISSYRVESGVDRVKKTTFEIDEPAEEGCGFEEMHLDLQIPSIPGAVSALVRSGGAGDDASTDTFPAVVPVDVLTCKSTVHVLTTIDGPNGWVAFDRQTLPLVPESSVTLAPTFASPRKKLTLAIDGTDAALDGTASVVWMDERFGNLEEPGNASFLLGLGSPSVLDVNVVDMPNGRPYLFGIVSLPPPPGACRSYSTLQRWGFSDSPVPFHVSALGAPTPNGASWTMDGAPATRVVRWFKGSAVPHWSWFVTDDARTPRPAVLPEYPGDLPALGDIALEKITHHDDFGQSYAERVADVPRDDGTYIGIEAPPVANGTRRARQTTYACD